MLGEDLTQLLLQPERKGLRNFFGLETINKSKLMKIQIFQIARFQLKQQAGFGSFHRYYFWSEEGNRKGVIEFSPVAFKESC